MSPAARISLIYFAIGAFWVGISDTLLAWLVPNNPDFLTLAQTLKGWVFVAANGVILFVLLRQEFSARQLRDERFRDLFANNPVPMWVYDRDTLAFLDVNEAACAHYGYTRDEFLAMRITDIRPPEEVPRLMKYLSEQDAEYRRTNPWRHLKKNREIIEVESSAHTLDFAGKRAVLVAVQDITERKRGEAERLENEKLRLVLAQEAEMHTMRRDFISMVSHEFRRPITTITTSIELLEHYRNRMTEEAAQKHFVRIHEQLEEMKELLDDFLTLMRTEAAKQEFKPAPIELTGFCRKLVEQARLSTKTSHFIRYTTNCTSITFSCDEKLLRHAIGNLLSNAVKYSPEGGEVLLELKYNRGVEIRVCDQGIGIPAADQAHLFDPFYRASNVGEMSGTGLGLPIARQAVELHGGRLELIRSDTTGTDFLITLPVDERTFLTGC
ncbi:MAG: PAS domain-containing sensor histidine kinase [Chloroflexota bacterium]